MYGDGICAKVCTGEKKRNDNVKRKIEGIHKYGFNQFNRGRQITRAN